MKENIENILVNWLYSDEGEDDPLDLDALAWELDKLFREEIEVELELAAERDRWGVICI